MKYIVTVEMLLEKGIDTDTYDTKKTVYEQTVETDNGDALIKDVICAVNNLPQAF